MPRHSETRYLPYTPDQLFDLVSDVGSYDEFLPWVSAVRIRSDNDREMIADLIVGFSAFKEHFTSRVTKERPGHICVDMSMAVKYPRRLRSNPRPGGPTFHSRRFRGKSRFESLAVSIRPALRLMTARSKTASNFTHQQFERAKAADGGLPSGLPSHRTIAVGDICRDRLRSARSNTTVHTGFLLGATVGPAMPGLLGNIARSLQCALGHRQAVSTLTVR